jgi:hypothetical protein
MITSAGSLLAAVRGASDMVVGLLQQVQRRVRRPQQRVSRCARHDVRSEYDIRTVAFQLGRRAGMEPAAVQSLLRELVELNTPALYLNVIQHTAGLRVMLQPWDGRSTRFRGDTYFVDAGAESVEGIEAFAHTPFAHVTTLYPTAPDHPVYAISIENQGDATIAGKVPAYLTHVTIVVNGRVITRCERLLHERGPQIWAA